MYNKSRAPRRGSDDLLGCSILAFVVFFIVAVMISALVSSCSVPAGGGSGSDQCHWERERVKPVRSTLTYVSPTIRYVTVSQTITRPGPRPVSPVKPARPARPGRPLHGRPFHKPHKPTQTPGKGYRWEYDCD